MTEEGLVLIRGWARDGLTDAQIAHNMGIAYSTFREWKDRYPAFSAVLKESKEVCDRQVENALYKAALNGSIPAMIFWLKNRKRSEWRDRQPEETDDRSVTINISGCEDYGD